MAYGLLLLALTFVSIDLTRRVALHKGRARGPWMWSAAFLGPLPLLVLAVLPARRRVASN